MGNAMQLTFGHWSVWDKHTSTQEEIMEKLAITVTCYSLAHTNPIGGMISGMKLHRDYTNIISYRHI